ncbi:uncharacterized protein [Antedon mediterranea]|uniref:uncharacterized protein n=1 Tax=Antedon mediterranea TaxID=105859 RepID=UPI003AF80D8D
MLTTVFFSVEAFLVVVIWSQYTSGSTTTLSPENVAVEVGTASIVFTCVANLSPFEAVTKHWMVWRKDEIDIVKNGTKLVDATKYRVEGMSYLSTIEITQTLTIFNVDKTDSGVFSCVFQSLDVYFVTSSSSSELTVNDPAITLSPEMVTIDEGTHSIVFTCVANLSPIEAVTEHWMEWKKDDIIIVENDTVLVDASKYSIHGASYSSNIEITQMLTVRNVEKTDGGVFLCTMNYTSAYILRSTAETELRVIKQQQTTDTSNSTDGTKLKIYLITGGIIFFVIFFSCLFVLCKISKETAFSNVNTTNVQNEENQNQEKDRYMNYYENIEANKGEMTEKTQPLPEQNNLNIVIESTPKL